MQERRNLQTWLYDNAPQPIRDWLDNRAQDRMAEKPYEEYLDQKAAPVEPKPELPNGYALQKYDGLTQDGWEVARDGGEVMLFDTRKEAIAWAVEDNNYWIENEELGQQWEDLDADQDRLEHEQGDAAENWSHDHAELERREFDQETHSERSRSEEPERGIEDDDELGL